MKKTLFFTITLAMLFLTSSAKAANVGDMVNFNVDQNFDVSGRSHVGATLIRSTSSIYFYVETSWFNSQTPSQKNEITDNLDKLSVEFNNVIYPTLVSTYGEQANPGIDNDSHLVLLFQSMKENVGGYFRSQDEYSKLQTPDSNEREMLYLPIAQINSSQLKVFLAHEFVHLIVFNQKDILRSVSEEVWLSEARSDYASTLLGYDDVYQGSNLQKRVQDFINQPNDSLTEWQGTKYDYAVESLFMHYLVDRYGIAILKDSLNSDLVGIPSINDALLKNNISQDFSQIFTDWTITMMINNCTIDVRYCYVNQNLKDLKINPTLIFLPLTGNSSLSMSNTAKNWSGNWQKIIGGNGDLNLEFSSFPELDFKIPYIIYDKNNNYTVNFLKLDAKKKGIITIKNFGSNYNSLVIIPSLQTKMVGFDSSELAYPYTMTVSITKSVASQEDPMIVQRLLDQIVALKKQIADLRAQNPNLPPDNNTLCAALNTNLYFGMAKNDQISCLQGFLKLQGVDIYPEGFVTGLFGKLTKDAVIRFQTKYGIAQTGLVGILTRQKINQLLLH